MINMKTLRILGLDDDNHEPSFRCEDGTVYRTYKELVEFLARPHDYQVEIKMFAIVDDWEGGLADYEEEEVNSMFDYMIGYGRLPENMIGDLAFELFWNSANRQWW